jgi:hypothetical protein
MFCGLTRMSLKSILCNLSIFFFSFMFDNLDIINLTSRRICLCCIMSNTKIKIYNVLKIDNEFCLNSSNVIHGLGLMKYVSSLVL